jgi:hypothetical protein
MPSSALGASVTDRLVDGHGPHMKATGTRRRGIGCRRVRLWFLDVVCFRRRLIPEDLDVGGGGPGDPVRRGYRRQVFELPLLFAAAERTAP